MAKAKRKAAGIEPLELWSLFQKKCDEIDDYDFSRYQIPEIDKIGKDTEKVEFDYENCEFGPIPEFGNTIVGLRTLYVTGGFLSFIGTTAGGDWERPVYFIIYLDQDGKTFRAYIPKDGNAWNYDTKQAFGNDEDADSRFLRKWLKKNAPDICEEIEQLLDADQWSDAMQSDRLMGQDISSRIEVVK